MQAGREFCETQCVERETTQLEFCVKQNYLSSEGEIKTSKKIEGICHQYPCFAKKVKKKFIRKKVNDKG